MYLTVRCPSRGGSARSLGSCGAFRNMPSRTRRSPFTQSRSYIDPTMEQDLQSQSKPWALSPLISTMPHLTHMRLDELHKASPFPPIKPLADDTSELQFKGKQRSHDLSEGEQGTAEARRAFFKSVEQRELVKFGPEVCFGLLMQTGTTRT